MEGYSVLQLYQDGGGFMHPILILFVIGLAISLERFWTLSRSNVDPRKFLPRIRAAMQSGGIAEALAVCNQTRGPVAAIFSAGLQRADRGLDQVEKAIINTGAVEMAFLEKNLVWLTTVISLAPLLGFLGTVWGMILAFKAIEMANDISPSIVAGGISVALITTLFGLIVAIIIQTCHNYFVSRIDKLVIDMEKSAFELVEALVEQPGSRR